MKLRYLIPFTLLLLTLSACNLTLAEDVTPPPDYVPPTPMPTLGPVYPAETPSLANGAVIYVEKCAPCHGDTGLGDGEQGLQLPVSVKAFGLPEIGRPASPEQYYTVVTQGSIERFMPPFASLTDQERWDVVAYVLTLHTTPEQVEYGRELFETNCADCDTDLFTDQVQMSKLSAVELARLAREGNAELPPFGADLAEAELWAVAAYLRTLSFDASSSPVAAAVTQTPDPAETESASAEATPVEPEQNAGESAAEGFGSISGLLENETGGPWPADLVITLHGFDHASGASAGAEKVFSQVGEIDRTGAYIFENIEMPVGRIFLLEAAYSGITLQSELGVVEDGQSSLTLPTLILYEISLATEGLVIDELDIIIHPSGETSYEVYAVYSFRNEGETVVAVKMADQQEIPFLRFPEGAQGLGYEAMSDSAPLINLEDGFALAPSERTYGIIAYSSFARQDQTTLTQTIVLPAAHIRILVPDGMEISGEGLEAGSPQTIQGAVYQLYTATNLGANESLTFELSGAPQTSTQTPSGLGTITSNNDLLVGLGVGVGILFILAGVWMYVRDRKRAEEDELDEDEDDEAESAEDEAAQDEFKSSEEVLDAIITLDDLHRAKKISDQAYQKRRAELKEQLKGKL